jgi:hypothetical protein
VKKFTFKSFFFSNDKEKRIFIIYLTVIGLVAFIISLIVIVLSTVNKEQNVKLDDNIQAQKAIIETNKFDVSDFIIPESWLTIPESKFYNFRQKLDSWSAEQLNEYWVPPRKIIIEILAQQNDKYIKELFETIQ